MNLGAMAEALGRGGLAGLLLCVPPGPMGSLCIGRSVRHGFAAGFTVAAGSALGDATYVVLASWGTASLRGFLGDLPRVVALVAAPILAWAGVRTMLRAREARAASLDEPSRAPDERSPPTLQSAAAGYGMALGTPGTLPALVAVLAMFGSDGRGEGASTLATALGALVAALFWWAGVAWIASRCRDAVERHLHRIDAATGAFLVLASLAAFHFAILGAGLPTS